uniref:RING-type domain-containing protein n=2 Tax=Caenorhabditis tropicalis TaxID=1561998 RepID=A0A1I7USE6_9PELO
MSAPPSSLTLFPSLPLRPNLELSSEMSVPIQQERRFDVSPTVLYFNPADTEIKRINLKLAGTFRDGVIRVTHNLPNCFFTDIPEDLITTEMSIHVNMRDNVDKVMDGMFIKFQDVLDMTGDNAITVEVKYNNTERHVRAFECCICLDNYPIKEQYKPIRMKSCGHTFCRKCYKTLRTSKRSVNCPFESKRKRTVGVPMRNFTAQEMVHQNVNELEFQLPEIEPCKDPDVPCCENERHESHVYCMSCQFNYCLNCAKLSHSTKMFSLHKLVRISEKPLIVPKCKEHPEYDLEYVCTTFLCAGFGKYYCWRCRYSSHQHNATQRFMDILKKSRTLLLNFEGDLIFKLEKFREKYNFLDSCMDRLEEEAGKHRRGLRTEKAIKALDEFLEEEKSKIHKVQLETDAIKCSIRGVLKMIPKHLKRRDKLHDIEDFFQECKRLVALDHENYENLAPPTPIPFPVDI